MKLNFEKIKKVAKVAGVVALGSVPNNTLDNAQKISSQDPNPTNISQSITQEKSLNPETTAYFKQNSLEPSESLDPLIQKINILEEKFERGLKSKGVLIPKSLTIIAGAELEGRSEASNVAFDDRYISDQLLSSLVNTEENAKIMLKDLSSMGIMDDVKSMGKEGYLDLKNGLQNNKPEYYFVVNKIRNNDSVTFVLQVASPVNGLVETLGSESVKNIDTNLENENIFTTKIIPNFLEKISEKVKQFELNISN